MDLDKRIIKTCFQSEADGLLSRSNSPLIELVRPFLRKYFAMNLIGETALRNICKRERSFFMYYGSSTEHQLGPPIVHDRVSQRTSGFLHQLYTDSIEVGRPYVCEVPDVQLIGPDALAVSKQGFLIDNATDILDWLEYSGVSAMKEGRLPFWRAKHGHDFEKVICLVGPGCRNYHYWNQDYLPRLRGMEQYCENNSQPTILIPDNPRSWMLQSLSALGYDRSDYTQLPRGRVHIEHLVVPSVQQVTSPDNRRRFYSPENHYWLQDRLQRTNGSSGDQYSSRIFVSREDALERRVTNRDELLDDLSNRGFVSYTLGELTFEEQYDLFSEAEVIIGPHGAGLVNMIYSDEPSVIELVEPIPDLYYHGLFYMLTASLRGEYGCIEGRDVGNDISVNPNAVSSVLDTMGYDR